MATGKSSVGKELAKQLDYQFVDTDWLIEERAGRSIADIFRLEGEEAFRNWEAAVTRELADAREHVIATGGKLMLDPHNAKTLQATGSVFCLAAEPGVISERVKRDGGERPLLADPEPENRISELLDQRAEAYARFPQITTDGKTVKEIATEISLLRDKSVMTVTHPLNRYNVVVGPDLLAYLPDFCHIQGSIAVITDSNVGPLYADKCGADVTITIPAGEQNKTLATTNQIYRDLLAKGVDRRGTIVALGGGVVGDVAGFVAATYMRGVALVQCPTSLLAMVDASVGGKTGVDLPEGKNLVGAFKQPEAVLADLSTLSTLPELEFSAGLAEVIKSGIIADQELFELIEKQGAAFARRPHADLHLLEEIVSRSIEVKRVIVQEDPYEKGKRAVLNLGHTFGHAIEQVSGYQIRHGEAVAMGLVAAANLSAALSLCSTELEPRIAGVLSSVGLPVQIPPDLTAESILAAMGSDKKKLSGRLHFILMRNMGDVFATDQVTQAQALKTLYHCGAT